MKATSSSVIHRVLGIPELLDMIFRYLDEASNVSNALVCKRWSEVALDVLWRDVDDLHRLFRLLAPFQQTVGGQYDFVRIPESSDWKRFEKYSYRVRRLSYQISDHTKTLGQSVFDDIARTRTMLNILPSMRTLEWNAPLPLCVMFMHSNVKHFVVRLPPTLEYVSPRPFFQDVIARMPNITHLDLRMDIPMHAIEKEAIELFAGLTKLEKVIFPRFNFTSRVAETLSHLEHLGVVEFQYYETQGLGDPEDTFFFAPDLQEGAFPALWDLSMTVTFDDASNFIQSPCSPRNLTMLYIDSQILEAPSSVSKLLKLIADNCRLLKTLALMSLIDAGPTSLETPADEDRISIATLRPLFDMSKLVSLELVHQHPLNFRQEDIEELAKSWPSLESLLLNSEPANLHSSSLTLDALVPFAKHCPNLTHLGLFVQASPPPASPDATRNGDALTPFRRLKQLSMGVSIIDDPGPVALFLSKLCPLGCHVESGVTWEVFTSISEDSSKTISERCEKWNKVVEMLPLLTKVRIDERERTKGLQHEVEDLRMRTSILMAKTPLTTKDSCVVA